HALRDIAVVGRHLGGDEGVLAVADVGQQLADHFFGLPVRRRRVDDRRARRREPGQHFATCRLFLGRRRTVVVGAYADDGQPFTRGGNGLGDERRRGQPGFVLVLGFFRGPGANGSRTRQRRQSDLDYFSPARSPFRHFFLLAPFFAALLRFGDVFLAAFFAGFFAGFLATFFAAFRATFFATFFLAAGFATGLAFAFAFAFALAFGCGLAALAAALAGAASTVIECTANAAPTGSTKVAMRLPPGTSIGGTRGFAPTPVALA